MYQAGKLAQVIREFRAARMSIIGISEMRWTGQGMMNSEGVTILYSGHESQHIQGVGLLLNKATQSMIGWEPVCNRIITARFHTRNVKATIIQVYAPSEDTADVDKDSFYDKLQGVLNETPKHDLIILIGDMNAHIDQNRMGFEQTKGLHGTAKITNDNGDR